MIPASREDYADAVLEGNCLGKRTSANRKHSFQNLSELYGLDARLILFRVMRYLWRKHESSRPLLGLLLALARDPLLRATAKSVIQTRFEREFYSAVDGRRTFGNGCCSLKRCHIRQSRAQCIFFVDTVRPLPREGGGRQDRGLRLLLQQPPLRCYWDLPQATEDICCLRHPGLRFWILTQTICLMLPLMPSGWDC